MLEGCAPWPKEFAEDYIRTGVWQAASLGDVLDEQALNNPQRVFLADNRGQLTYREVNRLADRLARTFSDHGLQQHDIALLQLPNIRELVIVFFALQKIGVVPVMCLSAHRHSEIEHFAQVTAAKAHFFTPGFRGFDFEQMAREVQESSPSLKLLFATGNGAQPGISYLGPVLERPFDERDQDSPFRADDVDPFDVAFMLLSGGTTGVPKLIPRTHADYLYNSRECARVLEWDHDTVFAASLPAAHNFALGAPGIIAILTVGGSVVLCASTDADEIFSLVENYRATVMPGTPALLISLLGSPALKKYDLTSLRQICVGGQRMLPELFDRLTVAFKHSTMIHAFGMAEGLTNLTRPDDPTEMKRLTQGRPVSRADEIRIVDGTGAEVAEGAVGELITRGPYTIRGYYRADEHNRATFTADGFYRTGDLVRLHSSGNLIVEGRKKDVINRGGEKISVEEVENLILSHPNVKMVAVVAMPDPVMGERGCAFVVPIDGASLAFDELNHFLMEKKIAKFKLPERLEILDRFPLTKVGKISKKALRKWIASELGQSDQSG